MRIIDDRLLRRYRRHLTGQRALSVRTRELRLSDLRTFLDWCDAAGEDPLAMDYRMMSRFTQHLVGDPALIRISPRPLHLSRRTAANKHTAVRSFYMFLVQEGWFNATPAPSARAYRFKLDRPLPSFLSRSEVERLLNAASAQDPPGLRDRAILEVLYATGVRRAELHAMDLGSVVMATVGDEAVLRDAIRVTGKGNKERIVLFGKPAARALELYLERGRPALAQRPSGAVDPLWLNRDGGRLSQRSIGAVVRRYARQAGLAESAVHAHSLRHSFATHIVEGGADLRIVQELLGHGDVATTELYTHITRTEARRALYQFHPIARESRKARRMLEREDRLAAEAAVRKG